MIYIFAAILMNSAPVPDTTLPQFDRLWDFSKPAVTEQEFKKLIPAAESSGDHAYHAELLTQIARSQALQKNFEQAHTTLDEAERLLLPEASRPAVRYALERGRVFNSSGHKEEAKKFFLQAWETALDLNADFYAVDAAHMMGIAESSAEKQHEWNLKALGIAEHSSEPRARKWLGALYNNIGWTYHDSGEYEKALDIFQKALSWRIAEKHIAETRIARWAVARTYRSLGRIDEALNLQKEILGEIESTNAEPDGYVFEEIGECLLSRKDDGAGEYFSKAYELLSKNDYMKQNQAARLERMKRIADGH